MSSTTRFVACSSSCFDTCRGEVVTSAGNLAKNRGFSFFCESIGSKGMVKGAAFVGRVVCGLCSKEVGRKQRFLSSSTYPASVFILDNSAARAEGSLHLRGRQQGVGKCNAALDQGKSYSPSSSPLSEFVHVVIPQVSEPEDSSSRNSDISLEIFLPSELPLLQVCPATIPTHDTDSVDDVLSQLLYAGFGNISSSLDGLLSVIFPRAPDAEDPNIRRSNKIAEKMEVVTLKPQAELCYTKARCVTVDELGSLEAFHAWLKARLPDDGSQLELWGTAPGTKRVANLWRELLEGEISLEDSKPPKRTVHVASVQIKNELGQMLVEAYQEMADGRIRPRNRPLSEKMRPGENVEDACLRGISEELGCQMGGRERVALLHETYRRQEEERESFSYPGLMTRYVIHTMTAHVKQLPSADFDTEEDEDGHGAALVGALASSSMGKGKSLSGAVGVKRHFWKWVQAS